MHLPEAQRRWAYGVVIAALAVLAFYGVLELEGIALWSVLAAAVLGIPAQSLALSNVGAEPEAYEGRPRVE